MAMRSPAFPAMSVILALLGSDLSTAKAAFAQGSSFGKVELQRPENMQEWASLLRHNILRQVGAAQSTLQIAQAPVRKKVVVRLVVDPDGTISDARLDQASDIPAVDTAVLRVVRNAQKQPPFTPDMPNRPLEFALPVNID